MIEHKPFVDTTPLYVDDRGSVYCAMDRMNCANIGTDNFITVKRTYVVHNWEKGRIRAWHGHKNGWTGMHVIHGAAKLVAIAINDLLDFNEGWDSTSVVLSDKNPGILWVPPGYFNGSVSLVDNTKILVYSTLSFEEVKKDDQRYGLTHNHYTEFFKVANR
ncbi:hypothetical protein E4G67_00230 [Candidatus Bathyarchaeota archaeon]|nr:MAG: hypothetical protein E4G67_00230 [Candidatus Bathyarchaeota archaeon]